MSIASNYIYDLDAIKEFIFDDENDRNSDVEITETQVKNEKGKLETESKIIREIKSSDKDKWTLKYDILKTFMDSLDNIEIDQSITPLSLGQKMTLNTLGNYGLIKNIDRK